MQAVMPCTYEYRADGWWFSLDLGRTWSKSPTNTTPGGQNGN